MYKAKIDIGGYKAGEEVPADKAQVWAKMYVESPVELVESKPEKKEIVEAKEEVIEEKPIVKKKEDSNNVMLDDYLGRNRETVVKSIIGDNLNNKQLNGLLELELLGKKRKAVIKSLKRKLSN